MYQKANCETLSRVNIKLENAAKVVRVLELRDMAAVWIYTTFDVVSPWGAASFVEIRIFRVKRKIDQIRPKISSIWYIIRVTKISWYVCSVLRRNVCIYVCPCHTSSYDDLYIHELRVEMKDPVSEVWESKSFEFGSHFLSTVRVDFLEILRICSNCTVFLSIVCTYAVSSRSSKFTLNTYIDCKKKTTIIWSDGLDLLYFV